MRINEILFESQLNEEILTELDWSKIKKGLATGAITLGALGISGNAMAQHFKVDNASKIKNSQVVTYVQDKVNAGEIKPAVVKQAVQKVDAAPEVKKDEPKKAAPNAAPEVKSKAAEPKQDVKPEVKKDEPKKAEKSPEVKKDFKATGNWKTKSLGVTDIDGPEKQIFTLDSDNTVELDFPYGKTKMKLHVRLANGKIDPKGGIFITSKGQFHSEGGYRDKTLKIKIDNGPVETIGYSSANDASSDIAFLSGSDEYSNELLSRIANSKQIKIQIGYFQNGSKVLTFNTDGLRSALDDYKKSRGTK
jgi:hypothetical protein